MQTILDCYTDEPAGLGVPPYLGTHPRYIAGQLDDPYYLTIDDLRLIKKYGGEVPHPKPHQKSDITVANITRSSQEVQEILSRTTELIIIVGVHTPGKYLSAMPGTLNELKRLLHGLRCKKVLTGPAVHGTRLHGGKGQERVEDSLFDDIYQFDEDYKTVARAAVRGASIIDQIPDRRIMEIETSRGCSRSPGCSFCLEPIKNTLTFRPKEEIMEEIRTLHAKGARHFRLGKQSCIYIYPEIISLLKEIHELGVETLHIDNANPANVIENDEVTKAIVRHCTPGNVAAFGVESFDPTVIEKNNLNSDPETTIEAVRRLNQLGGHRAENGMPHFLPGINLLLGLMGETKTTFKRNYEALTRILDEDLLLRRINIRMVVPFEGTPLHQQAGMKYIRKNRQFYYSWRKKIRENIDHEMLKRLVPIGTPLTGVIPEVYDGKKTFGRQPGTYPLIVGIKERVPLRTPIDVKVKGYMLRSVIGEPV